VTQWRGRVWSRGESVVRREHESVDPGGGHVDRPDCCPTARIHRTAIGSTVPTRCSMVIGTNHPPDSISPRAGVSECAAAAKRVPVIVLRSTNRVEDGLLPRLPRPGRAAVRVATEALCHGSGFVVGYLNGLGLAVCGLDNHTDRVPVVRSGLAPVFPVARNNQCATCRTSTQYGCVRRHSDAR
jgi:hypothetical protein